MSRQRRRPPSWRHFRLPWPLAKPLQLPPVTLLRSSGKGKEALQAGQFSVAEKDFQSVIALDPTSAAPHINLGVTYMREKRWDDALVELKRADSLTPHQSGIQLNIGLAHYRKNDYAAAIEPFTASLRLAPESLQARYLLGLCYFFTNKYQRRRPTR